MVRLRETGTSIARVFLARFAPNVSDPAEVLGRLAEEWVALQPRAPITIKQFMSVLSEDVMRDILLCAADEDQKTTRTKRLVAVLERYTRLRESLREPCGFRLTRLTGDVSIEYHDHGDGLVVDGGKASAAYDGEADGCGSRVDSHYFYDAHPASVGCGAEYARDGDYLRSIEATVRSAGPKGITMDAVRFRIGEQRIKLMDKMFETLKKEGRIWATKEQQGRQRVHVFYHRDVPRVAATSTRQQFSQWKASDVAEPAAAPRSPLSATDAAPNAPPTSDPLDELFPATTHLQKARMRLILSRIEADKAVDSYDMLAAIRSQEASLGMAHSCDHKTLLRLVESMAEQSLIHTFQAQLDLRKGDRRILSHITLPEGHGELQPLLSSITGRLKEQDASVALSKKQKLSGPKRVPAFRKRVANHIYSKCGVMGSLKLLHALLVHASVLFDCVDDTESIVVAPLWIDRVDLVCRHMNATAEVALAFVAAHQSIQPIKIHSIGEANEPLQSACVNLLTFLPFLPLSVWFALFGESPVETEDQSLAVDDIKRVMEAGASGYCAWRLHPKLFKALCESEVRARVSLTARCDSLVLWLVSMDDRSSFSDCSATWK
jgi:hypothetical protein